MAMPAARWAPSLAESGEACLAFPVSSPPFAEAVCLAAATLSCTLLFAWAALSLA